MEKLFEEKQIEIKEVKIENKHGIEIKCKTGNKNENTIYSK